MKYHALSRRMFLQGVGKSTLTIPFLPSLVSAQVQESYVNQPRFVALISRNGQRRDQWFPQIDDAAQMTQYNGMSDVYYKKLSEISGPISAIMGDDFTPMKDKISILSGLDLPSGGEHNTHQPLTAGTGHGGDAGVGKATPFVSIDTLLATSPKFYKSLPRFDALRIAPDPHAATGSYSWTMVGDEAYNIPSISSDKLLFREMFGASGGGSDDFLKNSQGLVIDRVLEDRSALLQSNRLSGQDKRKVEQYFDTLRDIQTRMQMDFSACSTPTLPNTSVSSGLSEVYRNHIDLTVLALSCSFTKLALFDINHFTEGHTQDRSVWHGLSHNEDQASVDRSTTYEKWIGERVLELIQKMDAVSDGTGTLLDNSLVYWGNEIAQGMAHKSYSLPVFTAGSAAGKLKTGYLIDYRARPFQYYVGRTDFGATGRMYNQFLTTVMTALGLSPSDYQLGENAHLGGFGTYQLPGYNSQALWGGYVAQRNQPTLPFYYNS